MKILLDIKKLAINDVFNTDNYEENTINLVDDGILFQLVTCVNGCVNVLTIPNKEIFNQVADAAKQEANDRGQKVQQDTLGEVNHKLAHILKLLNKPQEETVEVLQTQPFNLKDITNMIAVSQNLNYLKI